MGHRKPSLGLPDNASLWPREGKQRWLSRPLHSAAVLLSSSALIAKSKGSFVSSHCFVAIRVSSGNRILLCLPVRCGAVRWQRSLCKGRTAAPQGSHTTIVLAVA
ncbi:hypothetical protein E2C01_064239 [Portunus trituberculatus]|uniref:Uncharacterized protein n=1 Tax=Portunus trituberculatus TaxID=210409 RepID=A0A5B7HN82_PORTR|nr:hypothetical protein [Portunus trituberculatus]